MGLCFDFPSCILSKMKKGFNASAKFPAVKEKSAAFTGSCLGGKLPRPSRAHPAAGQSPSCARAFRLRPFCHFPVRSRLRDMPRRSQTRRFPISKSQERGLLRARFSRVRRAAGCRAQAAHIPLRDRAPPAPGLFAGSYFLPIAACASCPGAAKQGAFPSPKTRGAGR